MKLKGYTNRFVRRNIIANDIVRCNGRYNQGRIQDFPLGAPTSDTLFSENERIDSLDQNVHLPISEKVFLIQILMYMYTA